MLTSPDCLLRSFCFLIILIMLERLKLKALEAGTPATIEEAMELNRRYSTDELRQAADEIRMKGCGNEIHTCSIVNARSRRCSEDCKW